MIDKKSYTIEWITSKEDLKVILHNLVLHWRKEISNMTISSNYNWKLRILQILLLTAFNRGSNKLPLLK